MKIQSLLFLLMLGLFSSSSVHAHEDEKQSQDSTVTENSISKESDAVISEQEAVPVGEDALFAALNDFPNLHPMVVHFPIVLLLIAALVQLVGLFGYKRPLSWLTLFLLLGGFLGALLASQVFHPHTGDMPADIERVFEAHELYAAWTLWLGGIGLVLKIISHFGFKRKLWAEIIVFLFIAGSAVTVSLAGHLGSQMVYIENVGPKGKYIESHEESSEHEHGE